MPPWYAEFLACPDCGRALAQAPCECGFAPRDTDWRPQRPVRRTIEVEIGSTARADLTTVDTARPHVTYRGPRAERDSSELFSAAEEWLQSGAALLDLGCGPRDQAAPAAHCGAQYAGLDYSSPAADLQADAHAIPFRAATFDVVLSYAVFEHLYNPFLAASEVARVLRPGGVFVGVVSQGEPYHESFFHHTALGVLGMLRFGGLVPLRLWPSYDTLHSLATMGRYPRPQKMLIELVYRFGRAFPFMAPRKFFRWSDREKQLDELFRAASIAFLARKP